MFGSREDTLLFAHVRWPSRHCVIGKLVTRHFAPTFGIGISTPNKSTRSRLNQFYLVTSPPSSSISNSTLCISTLLHAEEYPAGCVASFFISLLLPNNYSFSYHSTCGVQELFQNGQSKPHNSIAKAQRWRQHSHAWLRRWHCVGEEGRVQD